MNRTGEMKRRTPMRAGTKPMARGAGFKPATEAKPAKGEPRQKLCAVKGCRERYTPDPKRPFVRWCSPECGEVLALAAIEAKKRIVLKERRTAAKAERRVDGERREALKGIPDLLADVKAVFNPWVRLRDAGKPCISCGRTHGDVHLTGGSIDCGHYRSVGSAGHLRFHEDNAHAQCKYCNRDQAGNHVEYRKRLVQRIGVERVEALENNNDVVKWTHDGLRALREHYRAKLAALKKEAACNP